MIHISLFSGIGGFDMAAEWTGWINAVSCEINPFGQRALKYYWPEAYHHEDIHTLDYETINDRLSERFGTEWREQGVVISGGFPCQPYSAAGKRLGKKDDRHLWPEMLRVIHEVKPTYVVGENVHGITNWNGGLVFEEVQAELEAEGYEIQPVILPAAGVNAPHRRDRVWFVAHRNSKRHNDRLNNWQGRQIYRNKERHTPQNKQEWDKRQCGIGKICKDGVITHTTSSGREERQQQDRQSDSAQNITGLDDRLERHGDTWALTNTDHARTFGKSRENEGESKGERLQERDQVQQFKIPNTLRPKNEGVSTNPSDEQLQRGELGRSIKKKGETQNNSGQFSGSICGQWEKFPTQSPICSGDDGVSPELVGITVAKHRRESLKAYGNAVVPQLVYQIFKAINIHYNENKALCQKRV